MSAPLASSSWTHMLLRALCQGLWFTARTTSRRTASHVSLWLQMAPGQARPLLFKQSLQRLGHWQLLHEVIYDVAHHSDRAVRHLCHGDMVPLVELCAVGDSRHIDEAVCLSSCSELRPRRGERQPPLWNVCPEAGLCVYLACHHMAGWYPQRICPG